MGLGDRVRRYGDSENAPLLAMSVSFVIEREGLDYSFQNGAFNVTIGREAARAGVQIMARWLCSDWSLPKQTSWGSTLRV